MTLVAGRSLLHYRLVEKLGEGGMGVVWRAADESLGREVAIKVLPDAFAHDPDRLERFEREARTVASLNHPGIAAVYSVHAAEGLHFITMELVEGEDLSQAIARGPIAVEQAVDVARQIAAALEAAHERGIVHRDLKPANVKLRPDGTVKVLDFGLAKAFEGGAETGSDAFAPTRMQQTSAGTILGTAPYMSPEQARGVAADRRADIWAFGVVVWEMLVGRQLFRGETTSDVLASVLRDEPDLEALPAGVPAAVRRVVGRCLRRDLRARLQWIGDARIELEEPAQPEAVPAVVTRRGRAGWAAVAGLLLGAVLTTAVLLGLRGGSGNDAAAGPGRVVSSLTAPAGFTFEINDGPPALTRDGRRLAYLAARPGERAFLHVRDLSTGDDRLLDGTAGAQMPFWSPDGTRLGFFVDGQMKRFALTDGRVETIAPAPDPGGADWGDDDRILFVGQYRLPPSIVAANGGQVTQLPAVLPDLYAPYHNWPRWLPDGRHYLLGLHNFSGEPSGLLVVSLDGSEPPRQLTRTISRADLLGGNRLLFWEHGAVRIYPFDPERLELGAESTVLVDAAWSSYYGYGQYAVSESGILVYQPGGGPLGDTELVRVDRQGRELEVISGLAEHYSPRISHDGRKVAVDVTDVQTTHGDVWVLDLERKTRSLLAATPRNEGSPNWLPDDDALIYATVPDLYRRDVGAARPAVALLQSAINKRPEDLSPDGRTLLFSVEDQGDWDLWVLDLATSEARPWLAGPFRVEDPRFSPDGRWVAYASNESGTSQINVRNFPEGDRRHVVSVGGDTAPTWSADGRELFYYSASSEIVAVPVSGLSSEPRFGEGKPLFRVRLRRPGREFEIFPDGGSFLLNRIVEPERGVPLTLVVGGDGAGAGR